MPLWRFFGLLSLGVTGIVLLTLWFFPTTTDFRAQNPFWNGLEDFGDEFNATPLSSYAALPEEPENSVLVVIPYLEVAEVDLMLLRAYLDRGGVLVLADDYGYGNTVLESLGVAASFQGTLLRDPLFNYRTSAFPLATNLTPSPLTAEVSSMALNYATVLDAEGLTVVARSSAFSYQDHNNDGVRDADEPVGPFPVAGYTTVGKGRLIVIADPSIFINTMLTVKGNEQFIRNLIDSAGEAPRVYIDQAHLPPSRLDVAKVTLASVRQAVAKPAPLTAIVVSLSVILLSPVWRWKGSVA